MYYIYYLLYVLYRIGNVTIAPEGINCWNPAFDVTPSSLIHGIITEIGKLIGGVYR